MSTKSNISVIIPVYNHAHTLERSLISIFSQTLLPLEVIIVNDGSTDNFNKVAEKLKLKYNIKIFSEPNRGASAARNYGFRHSTGAYVIFWDADTLANKEMLHKLQQALDSHPEAGYAYCQFKFGWKKFKCQPFNAEDLKKYNYIDTTSLIRREVLNTPSSVLPLNVGGNQMLFAPNRGETERGASGPFDESLARFQDWDLWLTLLEQNKTGIFVPEVLYTKIVHGRKGLSNWLPSFVFRLPFKTKMVLEYEKAKKIILNKHQIVKNIL